MHWYCRAFEALSILSRVPTTVIREVASQHLYLRHEYHTAPWIVILALKSKWAQDIKSVISRIMQPCHAKIYQNMPNHRISMPMSRLRWLPVEPRRSMLRVSRDPVRSMDPAEKVRTQTPKKHHHYHHDPKNTPPKKVPSLITGSEDTTEFCCLEQGSNWSAVSTEISR